MDIVESLTELSLTEREARLYAALLEFGQATPLQLAHKTGLKRPTVYLDLESLRRKKLVGLTVVGRKRVYVPESPNKLVQMARERKEIAEAILPNLRALQRSIGKPQIRLYDQHDDIRDVYIKEVFRAKETMYISDIGSLNRRFPDALAAFEASIKNGQIKKSREIVGGDAEGLSYADQNNRPNRQTRVLPGGMKYDVDIALWDDSVGLNSLDRGYMLLISDPSIAQVFRSLFEVAWKVSAPYSKNGK